MEITLKNYKFVLKVGMGRGKAKAVKNQHNLAQIEKDKQYAINPAGLYLTQLEMLKQQ